MAPPPELRPEFFGFTTPADAFNRWKRFAIDLLVIMETRSGRIALILNTTKTTRIQLGICGYLHVPTTELEHQTKLSIEQYLQAEEERSNKFIAWCLEHPHGDEKPVIQ